MYAARHSAGRMCTNPISKRMLLHPRLSIHAHPIYNQAFLVSSESFFEFLFRCMNHIVKHFMWQEHRVFCNCGLSEFVNGWNGNHESIQIGTEARTPNISIKIPFAILGKHSIVAQSGQCRCVLLSHGYESKAKPNQKQHQTIA